MTDPRSDAASTPISWRTIVYDTPVASSDDARVGTVREVLGSDADDIFHGLRVRLDGTNRDVMIEADDIVSMTAQSIVLSVDRSYLATLPDFDEPASYHLSTVGRFRHHLGWKDDSKGDEEPG